MHRTNFEPAPEYSGTYTVRGYEGVAWRVDGWETWPTADTEWTGIERRTGFLVAHMVGDNYLHEVEPHKLQPIDEDEVCFGCGQVGCRAYG